MYQIPNSSLVFDKIKADIGITTETDTLVYLQFVFDH